MSYVVMTPEIWSGDCCKFLMLATLVTHTYFHFFMQTGSRFHFHTQTRSRFLVGTRVFRSKALSGALYACDIC